MIEKSIADITENILSSEVNNSKSKKNSAKPTGTSSEVAIVESTQVSSDSPYDPAIPRKIMERICRVSTNTLIKYENEGVIKPIKVKHGGLEVVTYRASDVQAVLKKRGVKIKNSETAERIAVFNQKGGTGKSAFVQHMASLLSLKGRVLCVDLDSQADATSVLGLDVKYSDVVDSDAELEPTIMELMDWTLKDGQYADYKKLEPDQVIKKISPTLHMIPSDLDISEANYSLNRLPLADKVDENGQPRPAILYMIKDVVDKVKDQYDYIIFDCPPNIETLNVNCLFAVNRIVIPLILEAKCLRTQRRNEDFLDRLRNLHPGFSWDKILVVANGLRRENIKLKALAKLQDIYFERDDIQFSQAVFPTSTIIDKCSELREPVFTLATKFGKEFKSNVPQAKLFTDLFWIVIHEILDLPLDHLIFSESAEAEM